MIYTLRHFSVRREDYDEFVRLSEDGIWIRQERQGNRSLGLWVVIMGGVERIMIMTRYDSLAHWQETRAWGGERIGAVAGGRNSLVREYEVQTLAPLSRRQSDADAPEVEPGVYSLTTYDLKPADAEEARDVIEDLIWPTKEAAGARAIGLWRTVAGQAGLLYEMIRFDSLEHWERILTEVGPVPSAEERMPELMGRASTQLLRPVSRRRP